MEHRSARWLAVTSTIVISTLLGLAPAAWGDRAARAQTSTSDRLDHLREVAEVGQALKQQLQAGGTPPGAVVGTAAEAATLPVSAGGLQLITLGDRIDQLTDVVAQGEQLKSQLGAGGTRRGLTPRTRRPAAVAAPAPVAAPVVQVSNPYEGDDFLSRLAGMTQSETSVAWCGTNAAIGFNDSGSLVATLLGLYDTPSGSFSGAGWSVSTDAAATFTDKGALLPDPVPSSVRSRDLFGDPVLGCSRETTLYYASLALDRPRVGGGVRLSGISLSRSADGGQSFGGAVMAVAKDASVHFLDKPWMAVARGATPDSDVIHVTYTDFDFSRTSCPSSRTAIEYVRSVDGGVTWSSPIIIDAICGPPGVVQGSQVRPGLDADVFVAWEVYPNATFRPGPRQIRVSRSSNQGATFGTPVTIASDVTPLGNASLLQGLFRVGPDLQGLAVDHSAGPNRGNVYVTWHDGRNLSQPDPFAFPGCKVHAPSEPPSYCFGDILFSRSLNRGLSWSPPLRVNDDPVDSPVDQYQPALDVDATGRIFVFFYDRRNDDRNFLIDVFLARSENGGTSWANERVSPSSFAPVTGWEDLLVNPVYMGDYVSVAADATLASPGVIVAWGDNTLGDANVLAAREP